MANSYVEYTGDGVNGIFSVTFPYLERTHVHATVDGVDATYFWETSGSVKVLPKPAIGTSVVIERRTPNDVPMVDYHDGTVLTETDLNTAFKQTFYVTQEIAEKYERFIDSAALRVATGGGVAVSPTESITDQIVADVISSSLYSSLTTRLNDLDSLGEVVAQDAVYRTVMDNRLLVIESSAPGGGGTSIETQYQIDGLLAQYTTKIDANGYVSGFGLASYAATDGTHTSDFTILADSFAVVSPGITPVVPFAVGMVDGTSTISINGQLIVNGSIHGYSIGADQISATHISVTDLSALSADLGHITAGTLSFDYGLGPRLELSNMSQYPIWFGTGTTDDLNGVFYIKEDGTAKFTGAMSAGNGKFTVDQLGNMNATSVTIRDNLGNVILSSGTGLEWLYVANKPTTLTEISPVEAYKLATVQPGATLGAAFAPVYYFPTVPHPVTMGTTANVTYDPLTGNISSSGGAVDWSDVGYSASSCSFIQATVSEGSIMLGLRTSPTSTTAPTFVSLTFGIYSVWNGLLHIYEQGTFIGTYGRATPGDVLTVIHAGTSIMYFKNGVLLKQSSHSSGALLYPAVGMHSVCSFNSLRVGSYTGVTGVRPADVQGSITADNSATFIGNAAITAAQIGSINLVGNFNVKSATAGARMEMDANVIKVYDGNGVLRVKLGNLA